MRKSGKRLLAGVMVCLLTGVLAAGCAKKEVTIDVPGLAEKLLTEVTYKDELSEIDLETAGMIYSLEAAGIEEGRVYVSSGATAEEIAVFRCKTDDDAKLVKTALEDRVTEQKESFQDYVPEELDKLNKSVIMVSGKYAVLSISDEDSKAKDIINEAFK